MSQEIELKLTIASDAVSAFTQLSMLSGIVSDQSELENTYFDTVDHQLTEVGSALRLRKTGDGYVQTLKNKGRNVGGLHQREEWEYSVSTAALDLTMFPAEALPEGLVQHSVQPIFTTHFLRQRWNVHYGQSAVELVLDQGRVATEQNEDEISELELELKSGNLEDLLSLALTISEHVAVVPSDISKAERGYRMIENRTDVSVDLPDIVPQQSMESAFCALFGYELEKVQRHWQVYWSTGEWRHLNQVVVILGNMETQVDWFHALLPDASIELVKQKIHWLREALMPILSWWPACFELSQHALEATENIAVSLQQSKAKKALNALTVLQGNPQFGHSLLMLTAWLHRRDWRKEQTLEQRRVAEMAVIDGLDEQLNKALNAVQNARFSGSVSIALEQSPAVHRLLMLCRYFDHLYGKELGALRAPLEALELNLSKLSAMEVVARLKDWLNDLPFEQQASVHSWARSRPILLRDIKQLAMRLVNRKESTEAMA